jgi:hypothetical protein
MIVSEVVNQRARSDSWSKGPECGSPRLYVLASGPLEQVGNDEAAKRLHGRVPVRNGWVVGWIVTRGRAAGRARAHGIGYRWGICLQELPRSPHLRFRKRVEIRVSRQLVDGQRIQQCDREDSLDSLVDLRRVADPIVEVVGDIIHSMGQADRGFSPWPGPSGFEHDQELIIRGGLWPLLAT